LEMMIEWGAAYAREHDIAIGCSSA